MINLETIKQELLSRKQKLESRINAISADICHQDQPLSGDWTEQAVERENEEVLEALGNASQKELFQVILALQRIEEGNFQICKSCAEEIPLERLRLVPHTVYCARCAQELESLDKR